MTTHPQCGASQDGPCSPVSRSHTSLREPSLVAKDGGKLGDQGSQPQVAFLCVYECNRACTHRGVFLHMYAQACLGLSLCVCGHCCECANMHCALCRSACVVHDLYVCTCMCRCGHVPVMRVLGQCPRTGLGPRYQVLSFWVYVVDNGSSQALL